jgi:hypothetical protein
MLDALSPFPNIDEQGHGRGAPGRDPEIDMDRMAEKHYPRRPQSNRTEHDQKKEAGGGQDVVGLFAQQAQPQKYDKMDDKNNEYGEQQRLGHHPSFLSRNSIKHLPTICGSMRECQFSF